LTKGFVLKYKEWKKLSKNVAAMTAIIALLDIAFKSQEQAAKQYAPEIIEELFTQISKTQSLVSDIKTV